MDTQFEFDQKPKKASKITRPWIFKTLRLTLALSVLGLAGAWGWKQLTEAQSRSAYINAEVVSVKLPISGTLQLNSLQPGQQLTAGTKLGEVRNPRNAELEIKRNQLRSQIQLNQKQLITIRQTIADQLQQIGQFKVESQSGQRLEVNSAQNQVQQLSSELDKAKYEAKSAQADADRYRVLLEEGATSAALAEKNQAQANQAWAMVNSAKARLDQAIQQLTAAESGLQIGGSRTLSYSEIRQRELQTDIAELQRQLSTVQTQLNSAINELKEIEPQIKLNQSAEVKSPFDGTIWSVDAKPSEFVNAGAPIVRVMNCANVWVDAFFSEADSHYLAPGMMLPVKISGGQTLQGKVESIRGGTGRRVGQDVAIAPPTSLRQQVSVRIAIPSATLPPQQFCFVGRTVEVTVPKPITESRL
ncbi:HlyD family secretion protein [Leptolyngbya sp. AN03gr2]|uniref:HlyD family secretion protein n=1 Tax=unclassified Leptolyngbya TaxID=2650499 RepID=UPI003D31417B